MPAFTLLTPLATVAEHPTVPRVGVLELPAALDTLPAEVARRVRAGVDGRRAQMLGAIALSDDTVLAAVRSAGQDAAADPERLRAFLHGIAGALLHRASSWAIDAERVMRHAGHNLLSFGDPFVWESVLLQMDPLRGVVCGLTHLGWAPAEIASMSVEELRTAASSPLLGVMPPSLLKTAADAAIVMRQDPSPNEPAFITTTGTRASARWASRRYRRHVMESTAPPLHLHTPTQPQTPAQQLLTMGLTR